MARKLRMEYPGAIYHVLNRGDRREPIFQDDDDRRGFLAALAEVCGRSGWQVHAYFYKRVSSEWRSVKAQNFLA